MCIHDELPDPGRKFAPLIQAVVSPISQDQNRVVKFAANGPTETLGGDTHRIEGEEITLSDLIVLTQVFQSALEDLTLRVDERDTKHHHTATVMVVKVDAFGNLATCHRQKDAPSSRVTCSTIVGQRKSGLSTIGGFHEQELFLQHLIEKAHFIPHAHHTFEVSVAGEEGDDAIWDRSGEFDQQKAVVSDHRRIVAQVVLGTHCHLITATGNNQWTDRWPMKTHGKATTDNRLEAEDLWVHCQWRECS
mmetsp:Transcript_29330/g.73819  ORF Transcript_29330/g.73819 Transcript_29330/m.73819 type:complete len:248 (+) Transcript_29330:260-1003(+)